MGIARGTNIVTDGLTYGYDTGYNPSITGLDSQPHHNDYRFYKGIPATNLISSGIPGYFGSGGTTLYQKTLNGFSSASGVFQRNFVNNPAQANTSTYNNNAGLFHSGLSFNSLSASTEYVMVSFDFYMITPYVRHSSSGTGLNGYMGITYTDGTGDNHGWNDSLAGGAGDDWNNNSAHVGKWRKIALICDVRDDKTPSSINAMYIYNDRTTQGEGIFTNFVITEHTTLPTSPANWMPNSSTRSNTASLIDLKGNIDMDISNVSFDSTGQPTFDGTNDYIDVNHNFGTVSEYSFEWVENAGSTHRMPIAGRTNTNFYKFGAYSWRYKHGGTLGEFYHTTGATSGWHHWVVTYDGSTISVYQDAGSLGTNSSSSGSADFSDGFKIGSWSSASSYTFNGPIPVMKFYNKELSADEVKQNFNAYKNRFNL